MEGLISIPFLRSEIQLSNVFTKALSKNQMATILGKLDMIDIYTRAVSEK